MKKSAAILFLFLLLFTALYAQPKKVLILEPSGTVSPIQKAIVTAKIAEALTNTEKYDTFTGADLICVTQFFEDESQFFVRSSLIDNESGDTVAKASHFITNTSITELEKECILLAIKLAWWSTAGAIELVFVEGIDSGNMQNSGFFIGKFEVTQAQWKALMGNNPSNFTDDRLPVENVSWYDAKNFLVKLNAVTGRNYRLPTEAEWEFAASGGKNSKGYTYSGSNNIDSVAWYKENSGKRVVKRKYENGKRYKYDEYSGKSTHPVGTKAPNELGIYDMCGNVWEWCEDRYESSQDQRVVRGGGWDNIARFCRVSARTFSAPSNRDRHIGFRVVLPL